MVDNRRVEQTSEFRMREIQKRRRGQQTRRKLKGKCGIRKIKIAEIGKKENKPKERLISLSAH